MREQRIGKHQVSIAMLFWAAMMLTIFSPARASEVYQFERMFPELPEPWYFNAPGGVAADAGGNVYVADTGNDRIQKFSSSGTFLARWGSSGTNSGYFDYPSALAVDDSGNVYVADTSNNRIQKFSSTGTYLTKWGSEGSGNGQFSSPGGIAVDETGDVYVADTGRHRIQKFSSTGTYLTQWGSYGEGEGEFLYPRGVAVDGSGNLYVADSNNDRIQKFTSSGEFLDEWGSEGSGNGQFDHPGAVATDGSNNVYVADTGNSRVQKFSSSGAFLAAWGTEGWGESEFNRPGGIAVHGTSAYVADTNNNRLQKLTSAGVFVAAWGGPSQDEGAFAQVEFASAAEDGTVYVTDRENVCVQVFGADGTYQGHWGSYGSGIGQFKVPRGIAVSGNTVYVMDAGNWRIQMFSRSGVYIDQCAIPDPFISPAGIAVDESGSIYLVDNGAHWVRKFTAEGELLATIGEFGYGPGQFYSALDAAVDSAGNLYVSDGNDRIQKFNTSGEFVTMWGAEGSDPGNFLRPIGIGVDRRGFVYVADSGNSRIQKFTSAGTLVAYWGHYGDSSSEFSDPRDVAVDGSGSLVHVADRDNYRVQAFSRMPGGDLYFPHSASSSSWETEIAIVNPNPMYALHGSLVAFDSAGALRSNPQELTLLPHQRIQIHVGSAFVDPESIAYLIFEGDSTMAQGYTKFYRPGLYRVALPAAREAVSNDIPVTHIASNDSWWTGIALVNAAGSERELTIEFNTGETRTVALAPYEHQSFTVESLFGGAPQPGIQSALIRDGEGIIGLELFGSDSRLEGIPLTDQTATILYYPHVASNDTWWTGIVACNSSESDAALLISPYTASGNALPAFSQALMSGGKYVGTVDNLAFPAEAAWFSITSTAPVSGFELFGTRDEGQLAGFSCTGTPSDRGVFAKVDHDGWTGIALVNTEAAEASVTLTAYGDDGAVLGETNFDLAGYGKIVDVAEDLFPFEDISSADYISYASDRDLIGFQLNGSADGTMLDGLPGK